MTPFSVGRRRLATPARAVTVGVAALGTSLIVAVTSVLHASSSSRARPVFADGDILLGAIGGAGAATDAPTVTSAPPTPGRVALDRPAFTLEGPARAPLAAKWPAAGADPIGTRSVGPDPIETSPPTGPGMTTTLQAGNGGNRVAGNTIPGLGAAMSARVPATARQAITVVAADASATTNTMARWERTDADDPWRRIGDPESGRNGANGWTNDHHEGDRRSPMGIYTLTAAGGRQPDPGTLLPYEYRPSYYQAARDGDEQVDGAYDYVIAIDYNRLPGYPPSDPTRPYGDAAGGDIWLHVDQRAPTRGCVSVAREALVAILGWLSPASRPVIVMGDAATLAT